MMKEEIALDPELSSMIDAFGRMEAAGFTAGSEWAAAHALCQDHEGEPAFDWGHALCHRVEGDEANARYWYRRAGRPVPSGSFEEEWQAMKVALSSKP
jgi:hypothetical protein